MKPSGKITVNVIKVPGHPERKQEFLNILASIPDRRQEVKKSIVLRKLAEEQGKGEGETPESFTLGRELGCMN